MDETTGENMKAERADARLSWRAICIWLAALFVLHDYAFRSFLSSSYRSMSHPVGTSILMFMLALAVIYLAGLGTSGLVWRRLPRAKGLLIALSIFFFIQAAILTSGTRVTQRPGSADQAGIGARAEGSSAQIINHQAEGNLRSDHAVGCISISSARNVYTPADLYEGVAECIVKKQFQGGVQLHALAGVYGAFDALRVSDRTAHQAFQAIQFEASRKLPAAERALFSQELLRTVQDKQALAGICKTIRDLGPPNYHPVYMIQHGMRAFTGKGGSDIVPGFDQASGWEEALSSYLHCPPASQSST